MILRHIGHSLSFTRPPAGSTWSTELQSRHMGCAGSALAAASKANTTAGLSSSGMFARPTAPSSSAPFSSSIISSSAPCTRDPHSPELSTHVGNLAGCSAAVRLPVISVKFSGSSSATSCISTVRLSRCHCSTLRATRRIVRACLAAVDKSPARMMAVIAYRVSSQILLQGHHKLSHTITTYTIIWHTYTIYTHSSVLEECSCFETEPTKSQKGLLFYS